MLMKRLVAHLLNRLLLLIPALLLLGAVAYLIKPDYFIFGQTADSGWLILILFKYMLLLPTVLLDLVSRPAEFLSVLAIILPALSSFMFIEMMILLFMRADLGMKLVGLRIASQTTQPLRRSQLIVRTLSKYLVLAFFPFLLLFLFFNEGKRTVYDRLAGTTVVSK